jgi:hypothetical protein
MTYDLMVIAAHPDAAEVQMGGTLAKLARAGQRALIVDLCDGEPSDHAQRGVRRAASGRRPPLPRSTRSFHYRQYRNAFNLGSLDPAAPTPDGLWHNRRQRANGKIGRHFNASVHFKTQHFLHDTDSFQGIEIVDLTCSSVSRRTSGVTTQRNTHALDSAAAAVAGSLGESNCASPLHME